MKVGIVSFEFTPLGVANIELNVERETGVYPNNVTLNVSIEESMADKLTIDEIQTLALIRSKRKAKEVFEAIEPVPLDEGYVATNFNIIPPRLVKMEIVGPTTMFIGQTYHLQRVSTDQYGQSEYELIEIKANAIGVFKYETFEYTVVEPPAPEPTIEDYLIDIDFRVAKIELGV